MEFLRALFDFSFSKFVTSQLIRWLYGFAILMSCIGALVLVITVGDSRGVAAGLIAGTLYFLVSVVLARVFLEIVIVIFRIAEYLREMSGRDNL
jgi:thiamine transporter ThiT